MKQIKKIKTTPSCKPSFGVIDSLNSDSTTDSLSANQGRLLKEKLENAKIKTLWENWNNPIGSGGTTEVIEDLSNYDILYCICGPGVAEVSTVTYLKGMKRSQFYMYVLGGYRASYYIHPTTDNKMYFVVSEIAGWGNMYLYKIVGVKYE